MKIFIVIIKEAGGQNDSVHEVQGNDLVVKGTVSGEALCLRYTYPSMTCFCTCYGESLHLTKRSREGAGGILN